MWIGDSWIPPNGEILTVSQIQKIHGDRDTLVMGDSLARRFTSTLALVLKNRGGKDLSNTAVDNKHLLGKGGHGAYSYAIPKLDGNGTRLLDFRWAPLARDVARVAEQLRKQPHSTYSLLIVCIGIHDAEVGLSLPGPMRSIKEILRDTQAALAALAAAWGGNQHPTVVWRTTPYRDGNHHDATEINQRTNQMNMDVLRNHPAGVHVSNAAMHINPKSQGVEREGGDTPEHFNNIIRWVEIQCITHKLKRSRHE